MFVCVPDVSGILCLLWDGSISFWHRPGCIEACGGGSPITRELNIGIGRHWGRGWCAIIINIMRAGRWRLSSDTVKPSMYFLYLCAYLCVCSSTVKQKHKSGVVELVSSGGDLRPVVAANPSFSNPYVVLCLPHHHCCRSHYHQWCRRSQPFILKCLWIHMLCFRHDRH